MWFWKLYAHPVIVCTRNPIHDVCHTALKGEFGYELSTSKWLNSSSSGFLLSTWVNSLKVVLNRPFSICPLSWVTMLSRFDVHLLYTLPIYCFHLRFQNSLSTFSVEGVYGIPLWDFYPSNFRRALKIIIIAELFIIMTISHSNSDNVEMLIYDNTPLILGIMYPLTSLSTYNVICYLVKSVQSALSQLISTSVPRATFTCFYVELGYENTIYI